jgi:hypothetical protein
MAQRNRFNNQRGRSSRGPRPAAVERPAIPERKPPKSYGKPFIILEDEHKNAFKYGNGAWLPYPMTISQCRQEGVVEQLPQKINGMTRYEVRLPLTEET